MLTEGAMALDQDPSPEKVTILHDVSYLIQLVFTTYYLNGLINYIKFILFADGRAQQVPRKK